MNSSVLKISEIEDNNPNHLSIPEIYRKNDGSLLKTAHFLSQFINIKDLDDINQDTIINIQNPSKHNKSIISSILKKMSEIRLNIVVYKIQREVEKKKCQHTLESGPNIGSLCGRTVEHNNFFCGYHNRS